MTEKSLHYTGTIVVLMYWHDPRQINVQEYCPLDDNLSTSTLASTTKYLLVCTVKKAFFWRWERKELLLCEVSGLIKVLSAGLEMVLSRQLQIGDHATALETALSLD